MIQLRKTGKRGTDAHQRPDVQVDQVENEDDDVDDKDDEVETTAVAETALAEARLAVPGGAQEGADDEADDDLQDLHDAVGASDVHRVQTDIGHCKGRFGSDGAISTS